jgi:hypothetical protein
VVHGGGDVVQRNAYVCFVTNIHLTRRSDGRTHALTLATPTCVVTVEITVSGVAISPRAISSTELERMLHAPLNVLAAGGRERIV